MKIVLCCAGGFSTTMLMDSMKKTVKDSAKLNIDDFQFTAIPVDLLQSEVEGMDVLVIGPQIAHKIDYIKPIIDPYHIPYVIVDKDTYGKMDGATVMKMALIARKKSRYAEIILRGIIKKKARVETCLINLRHL